MISLGFWQLSRAEFKIELQQQIELRKNLPATGLESLPEEREQRRYHPVRMLAEFDNEHSFLLDNKIMNGRVGYHVYTPALLNDSTAVLVARGFHEMGDSRQQLPEIVTPVGKTEIEGILDFQPSKALVLQENVQQTEKWPVVLQYVDLDEIEELLGYKLYDMIIWLDKDHDAVFQYDMPVLNLNSAKNYGYAFQWFAMSLALLIIYLVVNTTKQVEQHE